MKLFLLSALMLTACAPSSTSAYLEDHPASYEAVPAPAYSPSVLAPAPEAMPPAPLVGSGDVVEGHGRSDGKAPSTAHAMPHASQARAHGQHDADAEAAEPPLLAELTSAAEAALRRAVTAYLTIGDRLASDQTDGVRDAAQRLGAALSDLTASAVAGQPHFWHKRAALLSSLETQAAVLAEASDVAAARQAFGKLSPAFVELLHATGTPEGLSVRRFVCGMEQSAPEDGVWLQRGDEARNPYFGSRMLQCHRSQTPLPTRDTTAQQSEPAGHAGHH